MTTTRRISRLSAAALGASLLALASEVRLTRAERPLTDRWEKMPIEPAGETHLGISFRPLQAEALRLDPWATLQTLLDYPFELLRLGAYWSRIEYQPGRFRFDELDRQIAAAEAAGKQIILCVGAVKAFGYPESFVPDHYLERPLPEGRLIGSTDHPALLQAACVFITKTVERYRNRDSIVAWQVEHEAVDPLGMEHSWRLARSYIEQEVDAVRHADPSRSIMMNGFLPTSTPVRLQQWWRTRDQGDSLAVAGQCADIVGIDYYPRHALLRLGPWSAYLAGSQTPWHRLACRRIIEQARSQGKQVMIAEGQAEPWEAVTTPPNPGDQGMYSCLPEHVIENYNQCLRWGADGHSFYAYLFWGAEYWVRRQRSGDPRYLQAFARVLKHA